MEAYRHNDHGFIVANKTPQFFTAAFDCVSYKKPYSKYPTFTFLPLIAVQYRLPNYI